MLLILLPFLVYRANIKIRELEGDILLNCSSPVIHIIFSCSFYHKECYDQCVLNFTFIYLGGDTRTHRVCVDVTGWQSCQFWVSGTKLSSSALTTRAFPTEPPCWPFTFWESLRRLQIRYHNLMIEWGVNWSLMQNVSFCVNICYCFKQQDSFSKDSITWALGEALIISGKSYNLSVTQSLYLKKTCLTGMRVRWVSMCKALADIWNRF